MVVEMDGELQRKPCGVAEDNQLQAAIEAMN